MGNEILCFLGIAIEGRAFQVLFTLPLPRNITIVPFISDVLKTNKLDNFATFVDLYMDRVKRIWYLSHMRAAKVKASLRIRAVSPEPSLLAHTSSESRGTFRQKARSLAPLNGWACAVKICHDGMLEDTNSLDGAHILLYGHFIEENTTHSSMLCSLSASLCIHLKIER